MIVCLKPRPVILLTVMVSAVRLGFSLICKNTHCTTLLFY